MIKVVCDDNIHHLQNILSANEYYVEALIKSKLRLPHLRDIPHIWVMYGGDGKLCAAVHIMGKETAISFADGANARNIDYDELIAFIRFNMPNGSIFCDRRLGQGIYDRIGKYYGKYSADSGNFMYYGKKQFPNIHMSGYKLVKQPSVERVYRAMCDLFPGYGEWIPFDEFYTTTIYKRNHDEAIIVAVEDGGEYVGVGGCYSFGDRVVGLSGIAVAENYRRKGVASEIVSVLTREVLKRNRIPVLSSATPASDLLYSKQGYNRQRQWIIIDVE